MTGVLFLGVSIVGITKNVVKRIFLKWKGKKTLNQIAIPAV